MIIDFSLILKSIPYVLSGLPYTLGISLLSFMVGNVFAIILAFMRMSQKPWLKYPARVGRALHSLFWFALRWCSAARPSLCLYWFLLC